jgi:hypothetical protein
MAITKKPARQELISASILVNATDLISTVVGTGTATTNPAIQLPENVIITSGSLTVITPFNTGGVRSYADLTISSTYTPLNSETVTIGTQVYTFKTALSVTPTPYEVLINGATASFDNLISAINGTAGAGTTYGAGTPANTLVTAAVQSTHVVRITSIAYSTANDAMTLAETLTTGAWGAITGYVVPADTITIKDGSDTYLTATSVDAAGFASIVPLGKTYTTSTTVDLIWGAASTTTVVPTAGQLLLEIEYYPTKRAQFTEG